MLNHYSIQTHSPSIFPRSLTHTSCKLPFSPHTAGITYFCLIHTSQNHTVWVFVFACLFVCVYLAEHAVIPVFSTKSDCFSCHSCYESATYGFQAAQGYQTPAWTWVCGAETQSQGQGLPQLHRQDGGYVLLPFARLSRLDGPENNIVGARNLATVIRNVEILELHTAW